MWLETEGKKTGGWKRGGYEGGEFHQPTLWYMNLAGTRAEISEKLNPATGEEERNRDEVAEGESVGEGE